MPVGPSATPIVDAMDLWWRTHRPDTCDLFTDELEQGFARIAEQPDRYPVHKETRRGVVRRTLMRKTRNHVYYVHDASEDVVYIGLSLKRTDELIAQGGVGELPTLT